LEDVDYDDKEAMDEKYRKEIRKYGILHHLLKRRYFSEVE
jgi:hypothetical protein